MGFTKTVSSTLSLDKDLDIINYLDEQNKLGMKTSTLIKIALRHYTATTNKTPITNDKANVSTKVVPNINVIQQEIAPTVDNEIAEITEQAVTIEDTKSVLVQDKVVLNDNNKNKVNKNFAKGVLA